MAQDPLDYARFIAIVREHTSFVITTHLNPDGDAIGSEIGLAEWLVSIGKTVRVLNHNATPFNYTFLHTPRVTIEQFDPALHETAIRGADAILVLDVNDPDRTRSLSPYLTATKQPVVVIDHHLDPKPFAQDYFIDIDASSTGELIYRLVTNAMRALGGAITPEGALAMYVGIMTDSGSFKFPRTDSELFRICADLLDHGADPVRAYNEVYNTSPASRLLLMRECLNSLEYHEDAQMALQCVMQSQLAKVGAAEEDVDGFVQMPFQVKGVVLSVFLLELREGWKISARSKDNVSAAMLAKHFGGNGHFHAAGARIRDVRTLESMKEEIVSVAKQVLVTAKESAATPD